MEFSGSVVSAAAAAATERERVTPEWTAAAAALAAAVVVAAASVSRGRSKKNKLSSSPPPLPFEALLRAPGEATSTRFLFHRRRHLPLARLFIVCGVFSAAAVAARSLAGQGDRRQQQQQGSKRSSAAGEGGGDSPSFPSESAGAASDALRSGDGTSPLRGSGSKLSKRGGGGGALDFSAEASSESTLP